MLCFLITDMNLFNTLLALIAAIVILKFWISDYKAWKNGTPFERALPGATSAPMKLIILSALVSVGIVLVETAGEYAMGATKAQSTMPAYYLVAIVCAGVIEEVLFRGFCVIQSRGRKIFYTSIVIFSIVFALIHGHLIAKNPDSGVYQLVLAQGPMWWTAILFVNSLWWYAVRFMPQNKNKSLLPCFAGHIASNLAVFVIKLAQGYVSWS
jgi:uncharacterized protein